MGNKEYSICINDEEYAFNLSKIKELCLVSDNGNTKEQEIVENWESDPEDGSLSIVSRINREMRSPGNTQNDTIIYDFVKMLITPILSSDLGCGRDFKDFDFPTALCFNTLLKEGIIYKL